MKKTVILIFFLAFTFNSSLYAQEKNQAKSVMIVYGSEDCHYCIDTKKYLKDNNIEFIFFDIDKNQEALKEMLYKLKNAGISTSNLGIPVVDKRGIIFTNIGVFDDFLKKLK